MAKRKYTKCSWCGKTIDITDNNYEICDACGQYKSKAEMLKAQQEK